MIKNDTANCDFVLVVLDIIYTTYCILKFEIISNRL
jgi:hypothetical protein